MIIYTINEEAALEKLYELKSKWGKDYPFAIRSWENNWDVLSPFYRFPEEVRKIIYTTYTDINTMPIFLGNVCFSLHTA